jgi:DNA-binding transcriptional MerR regulator
VKVLPGTLIETGKLAEGESRKIFDNIFSCGGLMLSQVCNMTGLEAHTVQNWVKRRYVSSPKGRLYDVDQFSRLVIINMLKQYNLAVLVFDPFLPDERAEELGVTKASLETIFAQCQVVSNHLANNEQTKGMLNGALFEKMLPYATFLNTGRGAQVVEADLIKVLKERPDLMAILDVTFPEPPEQNSELYTLENCILTPHIAGSSGNEVRRMGEYMEAEYQSFIQNHPCKYEVTLEMLKTMA